MKVTIVCDVLGKPNNGTSLAAWNLINYLKSRGHNVNIICPDKDKEGVENYFVLKTLSFGKFLDHYLVDKNQIILSKADNDTIAAACHDSDIVHCIVPFSASQCALRYCKAHNIPITSGFHFQAENLTSHLFLMNAKLANSMTYKYVWRKFYKDLDGIHYPTFFIMNYVNKYNKNHVNGYVISNGVNNEYFYPNEVEKDPELKDKFVILMSGRFSKEKNQIELIRAVKKSKYESKIQLIFTGNGPKEKYLIKKSLKLTNKPILKFYKHEELHDALWQADLYVHTSVVEIEAISVLEAFATGLVPVIANSPRSATKMFALDEKCLYKSKSPKDLADKIDYWIEHPEEKQNLKAKYIEYSKQFNFDLCMKKMESMLIDTIENHKNK